MVGVLLLLFATSLGAGKMLCNFYLTDLDESDDDDDDNDKGIEIKMLHKKKTP